MQWAIDGLARVLLQGGAVFALLGPVAILGGTACASRLRRRGALFLVLSSMLLGYGGFMVLGLLAPPLLTGSLAIPVVASGVLALLGYPALVIGLWVRPREQPGLELLYASCALGACLSSAALVVLAGASV